MKKYKVTEIHPYLKEGIVLESHKRCVDEYFSSAWAHTFAYDEINDWLVSGWIEEIQEPEFTKDDIEQLAKKHYDLVMKQLNDVIEAQNKMFIDAIKNPVNEFQGLFKMIKGVPRMKNPPSPPLLHGYQPTDELDTSNPPKREIDIPNPSKK